MSTVRERQRERERVALYEVHTLTPPLLEVWHWLFRRRLFVATAGKAVGIVHRNRIAQKARKAQPNSKSPLDPVFFLSYGDPRRRRRRRRSPGPSMHQRAW